MVTLYKIYGLVLVYWSLLYFIYVNDHYIFVCLTASNGIMSREKNSVLDSWNWCYRRLLFVTWVLRVEPGVSVRAVSVLNHKVTFPVRSLLILGDRIFNSSNSQWSQECLELLILLLSPLLSVVITGTSQTYPTI